MTTSVAQQQPSLKGLLSNENIKAKFQEILKDKAAGFTANLAVMVNQSAALSKCEPMTIVSAAVQAASLNLLLDQNLGQAYVVPYGDKAQFQIGYLGYIELAMRTGQYLTINVTEVYDGELVSENRVTGEYVFDFSAKKSDKITHYAAYFRLINGFEKTLCWPVDQADKHGKRFSQTYKKGFGLWKEDFDAMAKKTVLKYLLRKWGPKSIEMQKAELIDQTVIKDLDANEIEYIDNETGGISTLKTDAPDPLKEKTDKKEKPQDGKLL